MGELEEQKMAANHRASRGKNLEKVFAFCDVCGSHTVLVK
jgi:hypothetical protein